MRRLLKTALLVLASAGSCVAQNASPAPSPTPAVSTPLLAKLMDLAGALSNDGFKMRDRVWSGKIEPGEPRRLAVNLFRGNSYYFCAAADPEIKTVKVSLFGPDGGAVAGLDHREPGLGAVGVTAETTGRYFVQIETSGGPASGFCLLYLFK